MNGRNTYILGLNKNKASSLVNIVPTAYIKSIFCDLCVSTLIKLNALTALFDLHCSNTPFCSKVNPNHDMVIDKKRLHLYNRQAVTKPSGLPDTPTLRGNFQN